MKKLILLLLVLPMLSTTLSALEINRELDLVTVSGSYQYEEKVYTSNKPYEYEDEWVQSEYVEVKLKKPAFRPIRRKSVYPVKAVPIAPPKYDPISTFKKNVKFGLSLDAFLGGFDTYYAPAEMGPGIKLSGFLIYKNKFMAGISFTPGMTMGNRDNYDYESEYPGDPYIIQDYDTVEYSFIEIFSKYYFSKKNFRIYIGASLGITTISLSSEDGSYIQEADSIYLGISLGVELRFKYFVIGLNLNYKTFGDTIFMYDSYGNTFETDSHISVGPFVTVTF